MKPQTLGGKLTELAASFSYTFAKVVPIGDAPTQFLPANPRRYAFLFWYDPATVVEGIAPEPLPAGSYLSNGDQGNWWYFNARDYPGLVGLPWYVQHADAATMYVVEFYPVD